jgi:hypothetical protein
MQVAGLLPFAAVKLQAEGVVPAAAQVMLFRGLTFAHASLHVSDSVDMNPTPFTVIVSDRDPALTLNRL